MQEPSDFLPEACRVDIPRSFKFWATCYAIAAIISIIIGVCLL